MPTKLRHPCGSNYRTHAADLTQTAAWVRIRVPFSLLLSYLSEKIIGGLAKRLGSRTVEVGRIEVDAPRCSDGAMDVSGTDFGQTRQVIGNCTQEGVAPPWRK